MSVAGWVAVGAGVWVVAAVAVALLIGAVISRGQREPPGRDDE